MKNKLYINFLHVYAIGRGGSFQHSTINKNHNNNNNNSNKLDPMQVAEYGMMLTRKYRMP